MEVAPGQWGLTTGWRAMAQQGITAAPTLAASFRASQAKAAGAKVGLREGMVPIPVRQQNARRLREEGSGSWWARMPERRSLASTRRSTWELELPGRRRLDSARGDRGRHTGRGGGAIGIEPEQVGTIEPGKVADLIVVRGDPSRSISDVRQPWAVFQRGRPVASGGQLLDDGRPSRPLGDIAERRSLWDRLG